MPTNYFKRVLSIFIISVLCILPVSVSAAPEDALSELTADSAILVDTLRGQILFGKASTKKIHVSTACKIMTAILTIENSNLDSLVTVSKDASNVSGSLLSLEIGEKYDITDLLNAVILTSANDATLALAEFVSGNVDTFVDLMNKKAAQLKMSDTLFKNPTGLYHKDQYTTAYDLSLLINYAIENETFDAFFSSKASPWNYNNNSKILVNSNKLFWSYDGIDGGKTGYNEENKLSVVTTATRNDIRLISIVLDSNSEKALEDSTLLLDYGFKNFRKGILVKKDQVLKNTSINQKNVDLVSNEDIYYVHPVGENYIKNVAFDMEKNISTITKDKILGIATYTLSDNTKIDVSLYSNIEIFPEEGLIHSLYKKLASHKEIFALVIILVIIEIILVAHNLYKFLRKKQTSKSN